MERRKISENQRDILSLKIAEIVLSLSYDPTVQCIYFGTFDDCDSKDEPFMELNIICENPNTFAYQSNVEDFNRINKEGKLFNDFGLKVKIKVISKNDMLKIRDCHILFDRNGTFTKLKEKHLTDTTSSVYEKNICNQIEVEPSLETGIENGVQELKKIMGK